MLKQIDLLAFPNRGRQPEANDFFLFTTPEPGHQKNVGAESSVAQRDRFIKRGHPKPGRTFLFEGARALESAVAIGVRLHYGAHSHSRADVVLHGTEVVTQIGQRHFRPRGPGRTSPDDFGVAI